MKVFALLTFFLYTHSSIAFDGVYRVLVERQQEKKNKGWSLSDWLGTKKRIALMDQWLALNSSTDIFEVYAGGALGELEEAQSSLGAIFSKRDLSSWHTGLSLWIFGVEYKVEDWEGGTTDKHFHGLLRILGSSAQSSHIQLFYGKRKLQESHLGDLEQNYWGGAIHLSLVSFLGGYWKYQQFDETHLTTLGTSIESKRSTWGAFLDIWGLRFYGEFFKEKFESSSGNILSEVEGTLAGAILHF